jgi:PIN domain
MTETKTSRINYVFVDHENVSLDDVISLDGDHVRLLAFVGATQKKIAVDAVMAIQRMGSRAEYVQMSGTGPNALDFHIAFYIGRLAQQDQKAFFHIVSKDKGFDPLVTHLKSQKILSARSDSIANIPFVKSRVPSNINARNEEYATYLQKPKSTRPTKRKTLRSAISAYFAKAVTDSETDEIISVLVAKRWLRFDGEKTVWSIPSN